MKNKYLVENIFVTFVVIFISNLFKNIFLVPWWITFLMVCIWIILKIIWPKYYFLTLIFFVFLVLFNLVINRLISFKIYPIEISFDKEQSFFDYPGIKEAILRYRSEGLWIIYSLRKYFYSSYLILFSWTNNLFRILSPIFWINLIGFSGLSLMLSGIILYLKNKNRKKYIGWWFLLILISSALRVLGDSSTYVYLAMLPLIYFIYTGSITIFSKKYHYFWYLILILDILI